MLDLNDFFLFVQVVDRGGFTAASRTLRTPKSTLSHRIQQLEGSLGVRLLNRTSRKFGMTDAGEDFYRHAVAVLREAELAENAVRHRLSEPTGTIRCTGGVATMQFAMTHIISDFLIRYPKVNIVVHAIDRAVDIVGENFDVAIRAHSGPLPDSNLVQRTLAPACSDLARYSLFCLLTRHPSRRRQMFMMMGSARAIRATELAQGGDNHPEKGSA